MKKLLMLLLALCLAAGSLCAVAETAEAPAQEAETAQEAEAAQEAQPLTLHNVRYYFEHQFLGPMFFDDPELMLETLRNPGIFDIWTWLTGQLSFDLTYQESDFSFRELDLNGIHMLVQEMPKPEDTPLCARIYFCYQPETKGAWYYTVEYDNFFGESYFLCEWTQDGNHMDYGVCPTVDPAADNYEEALAAEAELVAQSILGKTAESGTN